MAKYKSHSSHNVRFRRFLLPAACVVTGLAMLVGCTQASDEANENTVPPRQNNPSIPEFDGAQIRQEEGAIDVATGLKTPWSVVSGEGFTLINQRDQGEIFEVVGTDNPRTTREIGRVDGVVDGVEEQGSLGMALDDQRRLYVYFTAEDSCRIQRFTVEGEPGALSLSEPETIFDGIPTEETHTGGRIKFGPDGMLYVSTGDVQRPETSQDINSLAGKILRITPDGQIPEDNPFPNSAVYSMGHRNVQGMAWAEDGTMFASEFGADTWDELNIIKAGANYGWPHVEGKATKDDPQEYEDPIQQWRPAVASPSGITIIGDTIYMANLRGMRIRAIPVSDPSTTEKEFFKNYGRIRDVAPGPDGSLWVLTNTTDGRGQSHPNDDRLLQLPL